jgi:hypothetical protein
LKAASDLLDRGPRTSKVTKIQATSLTLNSADVADMAKALSAAKVAREMYGKEVQGDWERVDTSRPSEGAA